MVTNVANVQDIVSIGQTCQACSRRVKLIQMACVLVANWTIVHEWILLWRLQVMTSNDAPLIQDYTFCVKRAALWVICQTKALLHILSSYLYFLAYSAFIQRASPVIVSFFIEQD